MKQTFQILPAGPGPLVVYASLATLLLVLIVLFGWLAWSSRHTTFEVSPAGLRLRGDLFGRTVPHSALVLDGAKVLDLAVEVDYQPRARTFGTGMADYLAGWFTLRNGEKALLYVTDWRRVLYVPTTEGYAILLSVQEPDALVRALRRASRPASPRA